MARTKAVKRQVNHKHRCKASKKTDEKEEEESQQRDTQQLETVAKISITSPSGRKKLQRKCASSSTATKIYKSFSTQEEDEESSMSEFSEDDDSDDDDNEDFSFRKKSNRNRNKRNDNESTKKNFVSRRRSLGKDFDMEKCDDGDDTPDAFVTTRDWRKVGAIDY